MNYLDKPEDNQSIINLHQNNVIRTLRAWNDLSKGATTEELKLLQISLEYTLSDLKNVISLRESMGVE
jgi:hypothetical protein